MDRTKIQEDVVNVLERRGWTFANQFEACDEVVVVLVKRRGVLNCNAEIAGDGIVNGLPVLEFLVQK